MSDELKNPQKDLDNLNKIPPCPNKIFLEKKDKIVTFNDLEKMLKKIILLEKRLDTIDTLLRFGGKRSTHLLNKLRDRVNQLEGDADGSNSR